MALASVSQSLDAHARRRGALPIAPALLRRMSHDLCRFSDAWMTPHPHSRRQASEKRQGTKSREVERRQCGGGYGNLATAGMVGIVDCSGRLSLAVADRSRSRRPRAILLLGSCCEPGTAPRELPRCSGTVHDLGALHWCVPSK
jgi:hypothetical protein